MFWKSSSDSFLDDNIFEFSDCSQNDLNPRKWDLNLFLGLVIAAFLHFFQYSPWSQNVRNSNFFFKKLKSDNFFFVIIFLLHRNFKIWALGYTLRKTIINKKKIIIKILNSLFGLFWHKKLYIIRIKVFPLDDNIVFGDYIFSWLNIFFLPKQKKK